MRCICGPMVANLYVSILEINWFKIKRPFVDYRFIDDKIVVLLNELNFPEFQKHFEKFGVYSKSW